MVHAGNAQKVDATWIPVRAAAIPCYLPRSGAKAFPAEPAEDEASPLESEPGF
jgi:hypothetical protein